MHCCDSYAVRRESRERWDFNYKDYSFASLLKAKTVAVINRVTWSQATNKNFQNPGLRSSQSSIVMRIEKLGWQFAVEQRRSPHQILLVRIWSIFPWKIFTIFFSSNCFGHKLGSTEPTAIRRIFPRSIFHKITSKYFGHKTYHNLTNFSLEKFHKFFLVKLFWL